MNNETQARVNSDIDEALQSQVELAEQYLTFYMEKEEFGVNILSVQEIRGWEAVTAIPNSPAHVLGVMNLRGTVVPVVDLRMCFGLENLEYNDATVVIILNITSTKGGNKVMGVVVDAVSDVHNFADKDIQPAPELRDKQQGQYVRGLGSTAEHMVILLDLNEGLIYDSKSTLSIH
jgi:purine-binding chemotaxis protein CheW